MRSVLAPAILSLLAGVAAAHAQPLLTQHHALSPDGQTVVFSMAGDLWAAPSRGGAAVRLTAHPALELASAFSPDGSTLAFESNRDGAQNLYALDLTIHGPGLITASEPRRVTASGSAQSLSGFTADGSELLFDSSRDRDIYRHPRLYAAPLDGGPTRRLTDAYGHTARMSPDGSTLVFSRGTHTWDRPIYTGPATQDLYAMQTHPADPQSAFTRLTTNHANDGEAFVVGEPPVVYFVSSRDGQNNLFRMDLTRSDVEPRVEQLTRFAPADLPTIGHGVRDLAVSADGSTAVFAVWDTLYRLELQTRGAVSRPIELSFSSDDAIPASRTIDLSDQVSEALPSPDGKAVAMIARGEIIVRSTEDDRPGRRVATTHAREQELAWSPDGRSLYFSSDMDGIAPGIYRATVDLARIDLEPNDAPAQAGAQDPEPGDTPEGEDAPKDDPSTGSAPSAPKPKKDAKPTPGDRWATALTFTIEPVVATTAAESVPVPSPDGRALLFTRGLGDLVHLDLTTGAERTLRRGWNLSDVSWAADARHAVFTQQDADFNADVYLVDTQSPDAQPVNITRHPDTDTAPRLSRDGKVLYFSSDRGGENFSFDVYAVYLDDSLEALSDYQLAEHFKEASEAMKKAKPLPVADSGDKPGPVAPLSFDTDDAYLRVRRLTNAPSSVTLADITPAGDRVLVRGDLEGDNGLHSLDHRGRDRKVVQAGGVGSVRVDLTGARVFFTRAGRAQSTRVAGGDPKTYGFSEQAVITVAEEQRQKFRDAARAFGEFFYHPTMKGLDWTALMNRYESLATLARTSQEFNRVVAMLFGEVDGSHTGISGGSDFDAPSPRAGSIAINATPSPRGVLVDAIIKGGPADRRDGSGLRPGDLITEIDGLTLAGADLDAALLGKAGKEILLTIERDGQPRRLVLDAAPAAAESNLRYEAEVARRRAEVDRLSDGALGYLHIRGMNEDSLRDFERDLYAAAYGKQGLIIDVRDNGGGSTADLLLASLTAPRHAYAVPRGGDQAAAAANFNYPRDRRFIHPYQGPLAVLCNANSFSNAEIFSHAIKTTGRGVLVGQQTYGGVISTGSYGLIDGATIRRPFRGWYLPDGTDMENNGAIPDIIIDQTPEAEAAGRDEQLQAAVEALLSGRQPGRSPAALRGEDDE